MMKTIECAILALFACSCSTLAQYAESQVPAVFEPEPGATLEEDFAAISYSYCVEGVCVSRLMEITRFEIEQDTGILSCVAIRQRIEWPDGSVNDWIWPSKESDPGCESAMQDTSQE